jgi:hypothetical protein
MDVELQLARDVGGFKGVITGKGYVEDFDLSSGIDVKGGVGQSHSASTRGARPPAA